MTNVVKFKPQDKMSGNVIKNADNNINNIKAPSFTFHTTCYDKNGNIKWEDTSHNTVTNVGCVDLLDKYFAGSAYTATWYLALWNGAAPTVSSTASAKVCTEVADYSAGTRPSISWNGASGADPTTKVSSANVTFDINATVTVEGAFIISNNTKSGTTGIFYSGAAFGTSKNVVSGDTLSVQVTVGVDNVP